VKFDVIRAVEACYARAADDSGWLDGLLESLSPHEDEPRILAQIWGVGRDGNRTIECEAKSGVIQASELADVERLMRAIPGEALRSLFAPSPPVESCLKRVARSSSALFAQIDSLLRRHGVEDPLGVFATEPDGRMVLVAAATPEGRPLLPARTLHQLTLVSAHLNSGLRLRTALSGSSADPTSHAGTDAVLDPGGRVLDASGRARAREARQGLAEAVRHMDRARGALRRTDPDEALQLWQGLVDGTWSLVDHCESDGKRFVLARRNEPGVRDPKALTQRERSVAAFAAMGHQNKFIGYLLGLSTATVSGHLRAAQRKLGVTSRAELVRCLAPLIPIAPAAVSSGAEQQL
jgi:DNA-binding CsgD family transcriptional regulator